MIVRQLQALRGGVADTSTLIYLERLALLPLALGAFDLLLIPQVIAEYGLRPAGAIVVPASGTGPTDQLICRTAQALAQPVLSEDRQVLRHACRLDLDHYNTLMLVLALCAQKYLPMASYPAHRQSLCAFARYGAKVLAVGDAVYRELLAHTDSR
ncbi:MAG: hypothetical protein LBD10_12925 [Desulfobulbus sp.]|uniref:hypothetical protein n=1 Tax=Desulfobulbus sp. TaxID=895 RepID=UPI00284042FB|nr:hypothetical protein [Desulfobulbus sp.]MDR2551092.1 hypothetical protein [Desulfobulbus sp.]